MTRDSSLSAPPSRPPPASRRGRWLLLLLPGVLGLGGWLLLSLLSPSGPGARASSAPVVSSSPAPAEPPARAGSRPAGGVPSTPRVLSPEAAEREVASLGVAVAAARHETVTRLAALIAVHRDPASPFPWADVSVVGSGEDTS